MTRLEFAREVRRRSDRRFADAIVRGVATGCPFPVVVFYVPDFDRLDVAAAGFPSRVILARIDRSELLDLSGDLAAILYIIDRALAGYAALPTIEHDHHLGQD